MKEEYKGFRPGDKIIIEEINDIRKDLEGKEAMIKFIDDAGQLHIDVTSVALLPETDKIMLKSGIRNGNMIFACDLSETGYITFRRTTYACDGTLAIVYYETDESGLLPDYYSGILTVNLSEYGYYFGAATIVIDRDTLEFAKEVVDIFRSNFTDGSSREIRYGYASSIAVTLNDDCMELIEEVR